MNIQIELFNFLRPPVSKTRRIAIPADFEGELSDVIRRWAEITFEEELECLGMERSALDDHINKFFMGLNSFGGPFDRDYTYTFEEGDLRIVINNTSPETIKHQSAMIAKWLEDMPRPEDVPGLTEYMAKSGEVMKAFKDMEVEPFAMPTPKSFRKWARSCAILSPRTMMDRFKKLGKKIEVTGPEQARRFVREYWPNAWSDDSSGPERTYWVKLGDETVLVAHHWQVTSSGKWYLRRAVDMNTIIFSEDY